MYKCNVCLNTYQDKQNHAFTMPRPSPSRHITKSPEQRSGGFVHKGGYSMSGVSNEITEDVEAGMTLLLQLLWGAYVGLNFNLK